MHKLKIIDGKIFLDEKKIDGVLTLDLHLDGENDPVIHLKLTLDPELTFDQTGNDA